MDAYDLHAKGDVVRFSDFYYDDPDLFMPEFHDFNLPTSEISKALSQVEAIITGFWEEGLWITYRLFDVQMTTNHFYFEVELTGEHRIFNDPNRYDRQLFDTVPDATMSKNPDIEQWLYHKRCERSSEDYRHNKMCSFNAVSDYFTPDEENLYLMILDNQCAACLWGATPDDDGLDQLLTVARERRNKVCIDIMNSGDF